MKTPSNRRTLAPMGLIVALAFLLVPVGACGPGGSVYVGVSAPGPWTSYPGGYYPGYRGYPGYRWEEEQEDDREDAEAPLDWQAPWAQSPAPTPPLTVPIEDAS